MLIVNLPGVDDSYTSVPCPSAARIEDPVKVRSAEPSLTALKVTVTKFETEENGVGLPPPKVTVPALLEKVGSTVQSEKADPVLPTLTTETTLGSNFKVASTALIFCPLGSTLTVVVKV